MRLVLSWNLSDHSGYVSLMSILGLLHPEHVFRAPRHACRWRQPMFSRKQTLQRVITAEKQPGQADNYN